MSFNTIPEMFQNTTQNYSNKKLFYYKKNSEWIGLSGRDINVTVKDIAFGYHTIQLSVWKLLAAALFPRRIRKSIHYNICQSSLKNIPYIVLADKMKFNNKLNIKDEIRLNTELTMN